MTLANTVRGLSSVITSESGSIIWTITKVMWTLDCRESGERRIQSLHGISRRSLYEEGTDNGLLVGLRSRDRAPLSLAGLERRRHDANAARTHPAPVGTPAGAAARCDGTCEHRSRARRERADRRARQQRGHRSLRRFRGD